MAWLTSDQRVKLKKAAEKEAKRFAAWRKKNLGMVTAAEASRVTGIPRSTISRWLKGGIGKGWGSAEELKSATFKFADGHELVWVDLDQVAGQVGAL